MFIFGFGFLILDLSAAHRVPVLTVARPIPAGAPITKDDLRTVQISDAPGLKTLAPGALRDVTGRTALIALSPGTMLAPDLVSSGNANDRATVAIALKPGRAPKLSQNDAVSIINTNQQVKGITISGSSQSSAHVLGTGKVRDVNEGSGTNSDTIVSLEVDAGIATDVAASASSGDVALVARSSKS